MVASTAERSARATYQDVLDAPAHLVAEVINGTLHTHPRPASQHALAASNLGVELGSPSDPPRIEHVEGDGLAGSVHIRVST